MGSSNLYSVTEAAALMAAGKLTAVQLVEDCLSQIEKRENDVQAWAYLDPDRVLTLARASDRTSRRSLLHGIPIAIKDNIDTADMPTEYGSPIYAGHRPQWDAACVVALKNAGALIMGKTVTVEFAMRHPGKTRNPHNTSHTPGGSSSGSAASVADYMVPLALGTQTGGSVIRPSSFCGIVGLKPTFNVINRAGVKPNSESVDTVGIMGRTVPDLALTLSVLTGQTMPDFSSIDSDKPRIGFCRTPQWPRAEPPMAAAFEAVMPRLTKAGALIKEFSLPDKFDGVLEAKDRIDAYEVSRALSYERMQFPERISVGLMAKLTLADRCTFEQYVSAQRLVEECRRLLDDVFVNFDVLLVPSTTGEAPLGLNSTGNSIFNRIWTGLHVPTVTVPIFTGPTGLPMGGQLVGPFGMDQKTMICAEWVRRVAT